MRPSHVGAGDRAEDRDSHRTASASSAPRNPRRGALAIPEGRPQIRVGRGAPPAARGTGRLSAGLRGVSLASALQRREAVCGERGAGGWSVRLRGARARSAGAHRVARSLTRVGGSSKARRDVSPASPRRSPSRSARPTRRCPANRRCAKDEHPFASRVRSLRGEAHLSLRGRGGSRDPGRLGSPPELPASAGTAAGPSATRVCRKRGPERTLPARMSHLRASVPNAAQHSHQLVATASRLRGARSVAPLSSLGWRQPPSVSVRRDRSGLLRSRAT